uniref:Protein kinase domain-containing protein n=1 Tax=Syphacia muris TaxID=451379 RepID=A0A0N5ABU0_9BILA
ETEVEFSTAVVAVPYYAEFVFNVKAVVVRRVAFEENVVNVVCNFCFKKRRSERVGVGVVFNSEVPIEELSTSELICKDESVSAVGISVCCICSEKCGLTVLLDVDKADVSCEFFDAKERFLSAALCLVVSDFFCLFYSVVANVDALTASKFDVIRRSPSAVLVDLDVVAGEEVARTEGLVDVFASDFAVVELGIFEAFTENLDVDVCISSLEEDEVVVVSGTTFCSESLFKSVLTNFDSFAVFCVCDECRTPKDDKTQKTIFISSIATCTLDIFSGVSDTDGKWNESSMKPTFANNTVLNRKSLQNSSISQQRKLTGEHDSVRGVRKIAKSFQHDKLVGTSNTDHLDNLGGPNPEASRSKTSYNFNDIQICEDMTEAEIFHTDAKENKQTIKNKKERSKSTTKTPQFTTDRKAPQKIGDHERTYKRDDTTVNPKEISITPNEKTAESSNPLSNIANQQKDIHSSKKRRNFEENQQPKHENGDDHNQQIHNRINDKHTTKADNQKQSQVKTEDTKPKHKNNEKNKNHEKKKDDYIKNLDGKSESDKHEKKPRTKCDRPKPIIKEQATTTKKTQNKKQKHVNAPTKALMRIITSENVSHLKVTETSVNIEVQKPETGKTMETELKQSVTVPTAVDFMTSATAPRHAVRTGRGEKNVSWKNAALTEQNQAVEEVEATAAVLRRNKALSSTGITALQKQREREDATVNVPHRRVTETSVTIDVEKHETGKTMETDLEQSVTVPTAVDL